MVRLAETPGTTMPAMPTWLPSTGSDRYARPVTVIRSQPVAPAGSRSGCRSPVTCTGSDRVPAAVLTVALVTGGPIAALSANDTSIVPGSTLPSKSSCIHCPVGPSQLPDSHMVLRSPSTAEYGSVPLDHWVGSAARSDEEVDAVTFAMPLYWATA